MKEIRPLIDGRVVANNTFVCHGSSPSVPCHCDCDCARLIPRSHENGQLKRSVKFWQRRHCFCHGQGRITAKYIKPAMSAARRTFLSKTMNDNNKCKEIELPFEKCFSLSCFTAPAKAKRKRIATVKINLLRFVQCFSNKFLLYTKPPSSIQLSWQLCCRSVSPFLHTGWQGNSF